MSIPTHTQIKFDNTIFPSPFFDDDLCEDCKHRKCRKCGRYIPNYQPYRITWGEPTCGSHSTSSTFTHTI